MPASIVLLHSPLVGPGTWRWVAERLTAPVSYTHLTLPTILRV